MILLNHMDENNYLIIVAPDTPNHRPDQRHQPDVLDFEILKNNNLQYQLCNLTDELSSDHSSVILKLRGKHRLTHQSNSGTQSRDQELSNHVSGRHVKKHIYPQWSNQIKHAYRTVSKGNWSKNEDYGGHGKTRGIQKLNIDSIIRHPKSKLSIKNIF